VLEYICPAIFGALSFPIHGITVVLYAFLDRVLVASRVVPVLILKELFLFALRELLSKAVEITVVLPYAGFELKLV